MNTSAEAPLAPALQSLVIRLLANHAYGVCELAQECAQQLHEPLCEIMTPLADSLSALVAYGVVCYDRQRNQVVLS